ncbi:hypothetical protein L596_006589 [Steinernema carpocapsae]|uniref:Uncharacterized protein n=1 Tax=Steinernema carpocapsae TaxID=34508 RepID=A0A4U8V9U8_STECR|nr:hypothetical protein L596_006589 [Steinernema carpocapsae]
MSHAGDAPNQTVAARNLSLFFLSLFFLLCTLRMPLIVCAAFDERDVTTKSSSKPLFSMLFRASCARRTSHRKLVFIPLPTQTDENKSS